MQRADHHATWECKPLLSKNTVYLDAYTTKENPHTGHGKVTFDEIEYETSYNVVGLERGWLFNPDEDDIYQSGFFINTSHIGLYVANIDWDRDYNETDSPTAMFKCEKNQ